MKLLTFWPGWETIRVIGSGGFGKVYEIRKTDMSGEYRSALKVISIPQSEDEYRVLEDDGYDEASCSGWVKRAIPGSDRMGQYGSGKKCQSEEKGHYYGSSSLYKDEC